jgi:hypothetical protein
MRRPACAAAPASAQPPGGAGGGRGWWGAGRAGARRDAGPAGAAGQRCAACAPGGGAPLVPRRYVQHRQPGGPAPAAHPGPGHRVPRQIHGCGWNRSERDLAQLAACPLATLPGSNPCSILLAAPSPPHTHLLSPHVAHAGSLRASPAAALHPAVALAAGQHWRQGQVGRRPAMSWPCSCRRPASRNGSLRPAPTADLGPSATPCAPPPLQPPAQQLCQVAGIQGLCTASQPEPRDAPLHGHLPGCEPAAAPAGGSVPRCAPQGPPPNPAAQHAAWLALDAGPLVRTPPLQPR